MSINVINSIDHKLNHVNRVHAHYLIYGLSNDIKDFELNT